METAKHREIEKQKETKEADLLRKNLVRLATDLQSHILSFLFTVEIVCEFPASMIHNVLSVVCNGAEMSVENDEKAVVPANNKLKMFKPVYGINGAVPTFFSNYLVLYKEPIKQMIHNLLFHINVEETLTAFAALTPEDQLTVVELKDPHGQRIRGGAGEIVEAAGDHALGLRLRACYKNKEEYDRRLAAWFGAGSNDATEKTMASYRKAIETLCQEIIECKYIPDKISDAAAFEKLLDLPFAKKFRDALKPNRNHVVTSGLLFDMRQIFLDFFSIFEANTNDGKIQNKLPPNLGSWRSLKNDLFDAIVYPSLQARTQRIDYESLKKGIYNVADGQVPDSIDFSKGVPAGFGKSHFFGVFGDKCGVNVFWRRYAGAVGAYRAFGMQGSREACFRQLCQAKTSHLELQNPNKITNRRGV